ncbi:MAG: phosphoenolpyruvate--protein phosphotransferase [Candidatus Hydrogenedens sp.]|nr:phosphoenolpyruvate--protein phosphotransferase [Candidatus Hydrogenedens sp.]
MQREFKGIGVSPGIAIGSAYIAGGLREEVPEYEIADPEAELHRLGVARDATRADLERLYRRTEAELGRQHAEILNAHLMLLDDVTIVEELEKRVRTKRRNSEALVMELTRENVELLEGSEDPMLRERRDDILDVSDRIIRHLMNDERAALRDLEDPVVVVGSSIPPSEMVSVNLKSVLGLALDHGGATSHTALLARALGVPAVMGLEELGNHVAEGVTLIVDGGAGLVIAEPDAATIARYRSIREAQESDRRRFRRTCGEGPCKTRDGVPIEAMANVALPIEVTPDLRHVAEGIGLYRTEFLFLNRGTLPSEEEQYEAYRQAVEAMDGMPVTIRTMDIGGDKFITALGRPREENPQLGWRALRFCLARPEIFKTQLRAVLRASSHGPVRMMFPMVSGLSELREARAVLDEVRAEFDRKGAPYDRDMPVGIMIEIPSAVAIADMLARECDFFSIGTNDLIQYTLAVDRGNEDVANLYQPAHPAVLRMIRDAAAAAERADIPCEVCGEMASAARYTELLLGLGVRGLSMSAFALPRVRTLISRTTLKDARALAARALETALPEDIEAEAKERADRLLAEDADSDAPFAMEDRHAAPAP